MRQRSRIILVLPVLVLLGALTLFLFRGARSGGEERREERVAGVEVGLIERRLMNLERTFSGALEAESEQVVAPKVGGRINQLTVDLADPVRRGQTLAFLDGAEFAQAVKQAEAELAVAQATLKQAQNALEISRREGQRISELRERGIASDSEYDLAKADLLENEAQVKVAEAHIHRTAAALESARIRYEYTRVTADWSDGDSERIVAQRFVDEGDTVSANQPLVRVVQLDPIVAVISVTERDYGRLSPGMEATFTTDAFPGERFRGKIVRIAPVFSETSRQARVEMALANPEGRLKPGMFIRATITLAQARNAVAVPEAALTKREDKEGLFLVDGSGETVKWIPVEAGIRSGGWVQLLNPPLAGRVVTLGQHLIGDGARIKIVADFNSEPPQ